MEIAKIPSVDEWTMIMLYIYTVELYSAVKNEILKVLRKSMKLKIIIVSLVKATPRGNLRILSDMWILSLTVYI